MLARIDSGMTFYCTYIFAVAARRVAEMLLLWYRGYLQVCFALQRCRKSNLNLIKQLWTEFNVHLRISLQEKLKTFWIELPSRSVAFHSMRKLGNKATIRKLRMLRKCRFFLIRKNWAKSSPKNITGHTFSFCKNFSNSVIETLNWFISLRRGKFT